MKYPKTIREEELKNRVAHDFFARFDTTEIIKDIDFAVRLRRGSDALDFGDEYLLWAEAKAADRDIYASFVQLILTIGQSGTVGHRLPPAFLGAFDAVRIAFIPYIEIADVFRINDFNWKVTPSNHETKEFRLLYDRVRKELEARMYRFDFERDEAELRDFIKNNLSMGGTGRRVQITKNNFIHIYLRWLDEVKPHIDFNWDEGRKGGILDCDFYRADLFVDDKNTEDIADDTAISDKLSVVFHSSKYHIVSKVWGSDVAVAFDFRHGGKQAYTAFWKKYKRPPLREYWDYIIDRRDLLVPQDIRERKGSFFTPQKWVALSQQYIADVLGEDWQEEYTVWDCAAGTGNLLVGLTNKYNIWASTLDKADVDVMHERIDTGADLLHDHVFQFDFLNDEFLPVSKGGKLPDGLHQIISDPQKRKKLVVYINPPYAEGDNVRGIGRKGVQVSKIHDKYQKEMGKASGEMFAQFFTRIYDQIPSCRLAEFSKLKILQAPNFEDFRQFFQPQLEKLFLVPADTFDNVKGTFPIGFFVWDTDKVERFEQTVADVYDARSNFLGTKTIVSYDYSKYISEWLEYESKNISSDHIGHLASVGNDFQNQRMLFIDDVSAKRKNGGRHTMISAENLKAVSIYFAVRKVIPADWLNDRDQFLYPNDGWQTDTEFQNDCLAYTLFNNNIQSAHGPNRWIPFTEKEVNARDKFASSFMTDFIAGKLAPAPKAAGTQTTMEFSAPTPQSNPAKLEFSPEARAVFDAGRALWRYYHAQPDCNVNASLYDIREHFQGRNDKGKMNNKSTDERYNSLIGALRATLKTLARKIEPKVYAYGFLKE